MGLEIERKFLVIGEEWRGHVTDCRELRDGLLAQSDSSKVRIRIDPLKAWITVKGSRNGLSRREYEYEIPSADAVEILNTLSEERILEKTRYFVPHDGLVWTVDVYGSALNHLVIAEIELTREDQILNLPNWVGREVTDDPRYKKTRLRATLPLE